MAGLWRVQIVRTHNLARIVNANVLRSRGRIGVIDGSEHTANVEKSVPALIWQLLAPTIWPELLMPAASAAVAPEKSIVV